jgi:hypothetical protein
MVLPVVSPLRVYSGLETVLSAVPTLVVVPVSDTPLRDPVEVTAFWSAEVETLLLVTVPEPTDASAAFLLASDVVYDPRAVLL